MSTRAPFGGGNAISLSAPSVSRAEADTAVSTIRELQHALERPATNASTLIDATGLPARASVPASTTLDGAGATVLVAKRNPAALLVDNANVTIRNLRLIGYHRGYLSAAGATYQKDAVGIWVRAPGCHIENVHALGWPHAGIAVGVTTKPEGSGPRVTIRQCSLSENMMDSLGYGVVVYRGHALIESCAFNGHRHHVAGSGLPDCSYEVRHSHFGPVQLIFGTEMHAPGGKSIHVHHNTFERARSPLTGMDRHNVVMRGASIEPSHIHHNWFKSPHTPHATRSTLASPPAAIYQYGHGRETWDRLTHSDNHSGPTEPVSASIGRPQVGSGGDPAGAVGAFVPLWVDAQRRGAVARGLDGCAEGLGELAAISRRSLSE